MILKKWKSWTFVFMMIGILQFIILTFIAMLYYKGGTYIDPTTSGYLFWNNFFSDLGRTIAHSGLDNRISFMIFTITLLIWGFSHIPFYSVLSSYFKENKKQTKLSKTGSILGILTGISYMGIALTPSDTFNDAHNIFVVIAFSSIFFSLIIYSIVIYRNQLFPNFYSYILIISSFILAIYYLFLFLVPDNTTPTGLFIHVVGQKVAVYTLLTSGFIQGNGALKNL
ncbi:MAG: hypothetical protein ACFE9T_15825 [Promethearchaeota archaeon]